MTKISQGNLRDILSSVVKKFPKRDLDFYTIALAIEVLRILVGDQWVKHAVFSFTKARVAKDDRDHLRSNQYGIQWQSRVKILAEKLFNLQHITGMDRVINEIRQGNLTSRFAEIDAASFLFRREIAFRFVIPSGQKESDYDIELADGINCEVKHKIERTSPSVKIVERTLHEANKQVPGEDQSLFFIKIPEDWTNNGLLPESISSGAIPFFLRNKKNLGVVFMWEKKLEISKDPYLGGWGWIYYFTLNPQFNKDTQLALIDKLSNGKQNVEWIDLREFVEGNLSTPQVNN
ncbi:hypothetical protein M1506_03735 [Patescibacteria group bacterium]|nr:hypothetical protein [Patescibacteria group bacterium]